MDSLKIWVILVVSIGTLLYTVISNYAIRGNDMKHLKEAIADLKKELLKRIERLENLFMNKGE